MNFTPRMNEGEQRRSKFDVAFIRMITASVRQCQTRRGQAVKKGNSHSKSWWIGAAGTKRDSDVLSNLSHEGGQPDTFLPTYHLSKVNSHQKGFQVTAGLCVAVFCLPLYTLVVDYICPPFPYFLFSFFIPVNRCDVD